MSDISIKISSYKETCDCSSSTRGAAVFIVGWYMVCVSTISQPGVSSQALPFYNRLQQYQQRDCCFFLQIEQFTFAGYRANMGHHRKSDNVLFLSESSKRPTFGVSGVNGGIIRVTPEKCHTGRSVRSVFQTCEVE